MRGRAVGQIRDSHVHKPSGQYVGELHNDMVVHEHLGTLGNIGNPGNPGNAGSPGNRGARRTPYREVHLQLSLDTGDLSDSTLRRLASAVMH